MKTGHRVLKIILLTINVAAVLILLASYLAAYVNPGRMWVFAFFGISYPMILAINLLFIILWVCMWKRYVFLSILAIMIGWKNLQAIYPFSMNKRITDAGIQIKIVSFNVHSLYGKEPFTVSSDARSQVTEFLSRQKADILFLQEFFAKGEEYQKTIQKFTKSINLEYYAFYNYQGIEFKRKINAIAVFSRYPIVNSGYFMLEQSNIFAMFADVVINRDTIRLYNLHLESIHFGSEDYTFYSHLTEPDNETDIENVHLKEGSKRLLWKLRRAFVLRSSQVEMLYKHLAASPYPVVLAGDFNDTPSSYTYHQLTRNLHDSYIDAGSGFLESTYAGKFPNFRIDYILYSSQFRSAFYQKFDVSLSDHYPITSTLVFKPKK